MSIFIHQGLARLEIKPGINVIEEPSDVEVQTRTRLLLAAAESIPPLLTNEPNVLVQRLAAPFQWIEAAGGLVRTPAQRYLMIYRRGQWDLPKGKIDAGENPLEAARREIGEETGITQLEHPTPLPSTYHMYQMNGQWILKKTHWFEFLSAAEQPLHLQAEEDIEKGGWMALAEIRMIEDEIYPSLRTMFRQINP